MDFHILSTHQRNSDDATPLQMVSAEQVAYWQRIETEYLRLLEQLAEIVEVKSESFKTAL
jgi:hypothetical protein